MQGLTRNAKVLNRPDDSGRPPSNMSFDATINRISWSGYTYDAAGDLTTDPSTSPTRTFQWDAEGRPKSAAVDGSTVTMIYNALGQTAERSSTGANVYRQENLYDVFGGEMATYNGSGNAWWSQNVRLGNRSLLIYFGTTTRLLHANHLGTTTVVTDGTGAELQDQLFYPWGQTWTSVGSVFDLHFASLWQTEPDSNTYPTPNRRYTPAYGRWMSPDPAGGDVTNPQSLNRYAYVRNSPTTFIDPLGLCAAAPKGMEYTPDCKHLHKIPCYGMVCADQNYGGSLFEGFNSIVEAICVSNGVAGYCNQTALASFWANGGDEFDAIALGNGFSYTPAGQLQIDSSGRSSTGTGSASFDDLQWSEAWGLAEYLGKDGPTTGYGTINNFNGTTSAVARTFGELLAPLQGTNFLATVYGQSFLVPGTVNTYTWPSSVGIIPGRAGQIDIQTQVVDSKTGIMTPTVWVFPGNP